MTSQRDCETLAYALMACEIDLLRARTALAHAVTCFDEACPRCTAIRTDKKIMDYAQKGEKPHG